MTGALAEPRPPVTLIVHGRPAPQGSKRAIQTRKADGSPGRIAMIESSKERLTTWRQDVKAAAEAAMGWGERPPFTGPLEVMMVFGLARPRSHYRTGRNAHLLRDSAPPYPSGTPDLSKLCRATEDALTGTVWRDDAHVVTYRQLAKCWADEEPPGAVITVRQLP